MVQKRIADLLSLELFNATDIFAQSMYVIVSLQLWWMRLNSLSLIDFVGLGSVILAVSSGFPCFIYLFF